ncbi:MAG: hypothetical protein U5L72_06730 [Bacteroidales bacterium]|nr:hypothetical protein [Bacteroidales bacterium]
MAITRFVSPDYDVFMKGYDKNQLMTVCRVNGFPHPKTIDSTTNQISKINFSLFFPAILKPEPDNRRKGHEDSKLAEMTLNRCMRGMFKEFGPCHLQELVAAGGRQYKVELYLNNDHQLINASVIDKQRFYPVTVVVVVSI